MCSRFPRYPNNSVIEKKQMAVYLATRKCRQCLVEIAVTVAIMSAIVVLPEIRCHVMKLLPINFLSRLVVTLGTSCWLNEL